MKVFTSKLACILNVLIRRRSYFRINHLQYALFIAVVCRQRILYRLQTAQHVRLYNKTIPRHIHVILLQKIFAKQSPTIRVQIAPARFDIRSCALPLFPDESAPLSISLAVAHYHVVPSTLPPTAAATSRFVAVERSHNCTDLHI